MFVIISKDSNEFTTFLFSLLFQDGHDVQALSPLRLMTSTISNSFIIFHFFLNFKIMFHLFALLLYNVIHLY
jgi:hypothetical protein